MMKRIAFFQDNLDVGGIQKSIMNLLRNFDYENYQVDLYLSDRKSFWQEDFPPQLNIKYLKSIPKLFSFIPFDVARKLVKINFQNVEEYDLAIDFNSYQFSCAHGALSVPAKRRVMWIHNDVSIKLQNEWRYQILWHNFKDKFKYFDEFVGVSKGVIEPFKECSGLYDKIYSVIPNVIDTKEIYVKASDNIDFTVDPTKFNIVALGRLCHQKGYDIMLERFYEVLQKRDDVHLYIIGDGDKRMMLEYLRDSLGLTEHVTFLGQKTNPFVYMNKMDAFISTSRYEGQGMNIMEARALGLPTYCTKNLEAYIEDLEGCEDIALALIMAERCRKNRDDLHEYNYEIIEKVKLLAESSRGGENNSKKQVNIIALHLGVGGVEKAIISMANLFAERYDVRLYSIYKLPGTPVLPVDEKVSVRFLLHDIPNRDEWKQSIKSRNLKAFAKESLRSIRIITGKRAAVRKIIKNITEGVIITTRHEDNLPLSKYGSKDVLKIAQLHHDHCFERKYIEGFKHGYANIDVLALLTPQLVNEAREIMHGYNDHTQLVFMPNFLENYPEEVSFDNREKNVIAVGRVTEVKRFELLAEHFIRIHDRAPEWKLKIIGDGEDMPGLKVLVARNKAEDYIELTGRMDNFDVQKEMCKASVFAMTSRSEGMPYVLMEAQSCGLPILAYDVRVGPGFIVHDGIDGFLVQEGAMTEYEEKLLALMNDSILRNKMGLEAVKYSKLYSREEIAEKWYTVIG